MWLIFISSNALSHDFWLEVNNFNPSINDKIKISVNVGEDFLGEKIPRIPDWFLRFDVLQNNELTKINGILGDDPAGNFTVKDNSLKIISYQSTTTLANIDSIKFEKYLKKEGFDSILKFRKNNNLQNSRGREYFSRYAKILINPINSTTTKFNTPTNLKLEITPTNSPFEPGLTEFVLLLDGSPLSEKIVSAYSKNNPKLVFNEKTDKNGKVWFNLKSNNIWIIRNVYISEALGESARNADWESLWASLVFKK